MIYVFVYGTLLEGESNHHIAAPYVRSIQEGAIRGRLFDTGPYPALSIEKQDRIVEGQWLEVTEEGLQAMDELEDYKGPGEDNEYERVWIQDISGDREGWVYSWEDVSGLREILSGSWRKYQMK
ncbi:gamma-glutamylcyclotransferase family protein [Paenibacillus hexagrammi]|uniref:Gamma-glutamylcyclotransferase n=1 Tax=Paenibacillus hexagrammi TaxID=2908839 RepID=A0ABY3SKR7_9BACL|nr:gamma-glutamylcyclotransferase family protein [Paenibacillus sp. YPD9-1]UJF34443.1 gamma-glutamylcyclotransferase [Paenibacillus sp. YPD9-1]